MPPVENKLKEYESCEGRNATAFNLLYTMKNGVPVLNTDEDSILAFVINKANRLGWLLEKDASSISECVLSYPNSKWYSLYVIEDINLANEIWMVNSGKIYQHRLFFQIGLDADGTYKVVDLRATMPAELYGKQPCQVINGQCVSPTANPAAVVAQASAAVAAPKVPRSRAAKTYDPGASSSTAPAIQLQAEIEQRLNQLNISGQGNRESREQFSRDYFENMNNKMTIIEWMVDHMATPDIVSCIKNKNTNAADVRAAEAVAASVPSRVNPYQADRTSVAGPSGSIPQVDQVAARAVQIADSMSEEDLDRTLQQLSAEEIYDDIKQKHKDTFSQLTAIKNLCGTTKPLEVAQETNKLGKTVIRLYKIINKVDNNGNVQTTKRIIDPEEALEECARIKAFEIKRRIRQQAAIMGRIPEMIRPAVTRAKQRVNVRNAAMARQAPAPVLTIEEIKGRNDGREIVIDYALSLGKGYTTTIINKNGEDVTYLVDPSGKKMTWNQTTLSTIVNEKLAHEAAKAAASASPVRSRASSIARSRASSLARSRASSSASSASSTASLEYADDIIARIMSLSTLDEQVQALIEEAKKVGYEVKKDSKSGKYYIINPEDGEMDYFIYNGEINDVVLGQIAEVSGSANHPDVTAFGRKRSKKTKKCAKKVKKTKKGKRCAKKVKKVKRCSKKVSDDTDSESESDDDEPKKKRKSKKTVKKGKKTVKKGKKTVKKGCKGKVSKKQAAHRKRFSIAVKKCKGKSNYQSCMKKALSCKRSAFGKKRAVKMAGNKTYTKSGALRKKFLKSRGRMSPNVSATSKPVGTKMVGNNGGMWVIKKTVTGVKRWVKV